MIIGSIIYPTAQTSPILNYLDGVTFFLEINLYFGN